MNQQYQYQPQATSLNAVPEANPTVGGELDINEKRLSALHETISQLEQRLSPVLRSTVPQKDTQAPGTPAMPWSGVVCALRNAGYQTDGAIARLQDVLSRLDL